jgi:hypothetical protein
MKSLLWIEKSAPAHGSSAIRSILASTLRTQSTYIWLWRGRNSLALWPSEAHDIYRLVLKIAIRGRQCCPSAGDKNSRCQPENFCAHSRKYIGTQQGVTNLRRILPTMCNCERSLEGHHRTVLCIMRGAVCGAEPRCHASSRITKRPPTCTLRRLPTL